MHFLIKDVIIFNEKWNEQIDRNLFWEFHDKNINLNEKAENLEENFEKNKTFM